MLVFGLMLLPSSAPSALAGGNQQGGQQQQQPNQGDELDSASEIALSQTKTMLTDPKERDKAIGKDPSARKADKDVKDLAGSDQAAEAIYALSADIMETITRESKGDPNKMKDLLADAVRDPAGFAARFSPEQKAKLRSIADTIPDQNPKKSQP